MFLDEHNKTILYLYKTYVLKHCKINFLEITNLYYNNNFRDEYGVKNEQDECLEVMSWVVVLLLP